MLFISPYYIKPNLPECLIRNLFSPILERKQIVQLRS